MTTKAGVRPDEGLMMMQELDDRLKEQIDKLEHLRLAAAELKDNLSAVPCMKSHSCVHFLTYLIIFSVSRATVI